MASDAAAHFDAPPEDPMEDRRARARSVSAELEAIFGEPVAQDRGDGARGVRLRRAGAGKPGARRFSVAGLGGLAAAALAGIAAGSLLVKPDRAAAPAPRPAALPVEMAPPVQTPQAADAALAAPALAPALAPPVTYALRAPSAAPPPARPLRRAKANRTHARQDCCSYAEVKAADRRLRAAYAEAIRSGAPRSVIVSARDRWAGARRRSAHDPARLVASYRDIAGDLTRASAHAESHPPRAIRTRFRPRYPAWWW